MSDIKYKLKNKIWLAIIPVLVIGAAVVYVTFFAEEGLFATHPTPGNINQSMDCDFADDACASFDNPSLTAPLVNFGCYNDNGTPSNPNDDIDCGVQIGAQNDTEVTGWAFSSQYGWINLNCLTDDSCSQQDFGVSLNVDTSTGDWYLSDRAWGEIAGWILLDSAICDSGVDNDNDGFNDSNGDLGCPPPGDPIFPFRVNLNYNDSIGRTEFYGSAWAENVGFLVFSCPNELGEGGAAPPPPTCVTTSWIPPECSDGIDNDEDGLIDYGALGDPDCKNFRDDSESSDIDLGGQAQALACSPSPQTVGIGQTASFTASGGGGPSSYSWSGGENPTPTGTGSSFSTSYSSAGSRIVTVASGQASADCNVTVRPSGGVVSISTLTGQNIECKIQSPPPPIEVGDTVSFYAQNGQSPYIWNAPGGVPDTGPNSLSFQTSYSSPGLYSVTVFGTGEQYSSVCQFDVVEPTLPPLPPIDQCPNLSEDTPPMGYEVKQDIVTGDDICCLVEQIGVNGQCVDVPPPPPPEDLCLNVDGEQLSLAPGIMDVDQGICFCTDPLMTFDPIDFVCVPPVPEFECNDGDDNDEDELIDDEDPACYPDLFNPYTYDPTHDSEIGCLDNKALFGEYLDVWELIRDPGFIPNPALSVNYGDGPPFRSLRFDVQNFQVASARKLLGAVCTDENTDQPNFYGQDTENIVRGFQYLKNISVDGFLGYQTLFVLRDAICAGEPPVECMPLMTFDITQDCNVDEDDDEDGILNENDEDCDVCPDMDGIQLDPSECPTLEIDVEESTEEDDEEDLEITLDIGQEDKILPSPGDLSVEVTDGDGGSFGDVISDIENVISNSWNNLTTTFGIGTFFGTIAASPFVKNAGKFFKTSSGKVLAKFFGPLGVAFGAIAMGLSFFSGTPTLAALPKRFGEFFLGIVGIPKRKPWGVVYHSDNKFGLDPVVVDLIGIDDPGYKKTVLSDIEGRYAFAPPPPGRYTMTAKKDGFDFPSEKLKGQLHDGVFKDLYFGGEFEVKKNEPITKNIPMDQKEYNWNEYIKNKEGYTRKALRRWKLYKVFSAIFYIGFIVSAVLLIAFTTTYNAIIFALYVLFAFMRRRGIKPKAMGRVMDKDGNPMAFAVIQVFNANLDILTKKVVADAAGLYYCLVPKGAYYVKIQSKLPDGTYSTPFTSKPFGAKRGHIMKTFRIKRPL